MGDSKFKRLVFVGTYSEVIKLGTGQVLDAKGEGIYTFSMDPETGELTLLSKALAEPNPTFIAMDKTQTYVYSTNELKTYHGLVSGACSAFKLDKNTGKLTLINRVATGGTDAVHCMINEANTHLLCANYMSGSVTMMPFGEGGKLESPSCFIQHYGTGPDKNRQMGPHAHMFYMDKKQKRAFIPDLGDDRVYIYNINWEKGHLNENNPAYVQLHGGEGPRHCVFDETGKYFYVINEMGNTIYAYEYNEEDGSLKEIQIIATVPEDFPEWTTTAAIKIHPNGKFLYGSNRGHNSLATYSIDKNTGRLTLIGYQSTHGETPRDFEFTADGKFCIVGNQDTNTVVTFKVDEETGALTETSRVDNIFTNTCIKIYDMI